MHTSHKPQNGLGAQLTLDMLEHDVHTVIHRLRTAEPVSWIPVLDAWLVTKRSLTIEVMRDAQTYTVDHPGFSTAQVVGSSMLSLDGAEHVRHRSPFERPFRKREVHTRFAEAVQNAITQLLTQFTADGRAELRRAFAGPIAVQTMLVALGIEEASVTAVLGWYDTIVEAVTRVSAGEPVSVEGRTAFDALRQTLLPALTQQPESSLLAAAANQADGLSDEQIISNAAVLLFGGIETTEGMIANVIYHLLMNPDVLGAVQENLSIVPAVVEESLRLEPAAAVVDRYTTTDVELAGAYIKEGDLVRVSLSGANRDPDTFPNPDKFDPWRPNLRDHVTFAQGPHVCLGLHLARLEAQYALEQLLTRLPAMRLMEGAGVQAAAQPRGLVFRKPQALHVTW